MSRKKRTTKGKTSPVIRDGLLYIEYDITAEPMPDRQYRKLPRAVKDEFEKFHGLITTDPRKVIAEVPQWIKRYPKIPLLYNYLSSAYSLAGHQREAEETILENLKRNPDYLFARLNFAELCLARGDYAAVAETLEHKFDLKLLYPNRNRFHISEVVTFNYVVSRYWLGMGERAAAEKYYALLLQLAPDDPITRHLHSVLHPGPIQRIAQRLLPKTLANKK
jgi:tetratricopeptide (TPR) repeat protein